MQKSVSLSNDNRNNLLTSKCGLFFTDLSPPPHALLSLLTRSLLTLASLSVAPPSSFRRSVPGLGEAGGSVQHGAGRRLHLSQSVRGHHAHAGEQRQHLHQGTEGGKKKKNTLVFLSHNLILSTAFSSLLT